MSVNIHELNKAFESRIRLGIMAALMANDALDFTSMRELLEVTDGNLATHLKALEKEGYIDVRKSFIERKPNTRYQATEAGRAAFSAHLNVLEKLIRGSV